MLLFPQHIDHPFNITFKQLILQLLLNLKLKTRTKTLQKPFFFRNNLFHQYQSSAFLHQRNAPLQKFITIGNSSRSQKVSFFPLIVLNPSSQYLSILHAKLTKHCLHSKRLLSYRVNPEETHLRTAHR